MEPHRMELKFSSVQPGSGEGPSEAELQGDSSEEDQFKARMMMLGARVRLKVEPRKESLSLEKRLSNRWTLMNLLMTLPGSGRVVTH